MTHPIIPGGLCAAFELNLADSIESVVGDEKRFFGKVEANVMLFFVKFDTIQFD